MPLLETPPLGTERLTLRPLVAGDAAALFIVFSDTEVMRYWSSPPWETMEQASRYVASANEGLAKGATLRFGIELVETGELIGQVALYSFDQQNRRCDVGYALGRAYWGQGYLREALEVLLEHAFGALDLNRVEADIDPRNTASAKALTRLGFLSVGVLLVGLIVGGEVCDTELYGLLRSDWEALRPR
jgi:RimJ/RimL family protein N-acetyltransferase